MNTQPDTVSIDGIMDDANRVLNGMRLGVLRKAKAFVEVRDSMPYIDGITPDRFAERVVIEYPILWGFGKWKHVLYNEPHPNYDDWSPSASSLLAERVNKLINIVTMH